MVVGRRRRWAAQGGGGGGTVHSKREMWTVDRQRQRYRAETIPSRPDLVDQRPEPLLAVAQAISVFGLSPPLLASTSSEHWVEFLPKSVMVLQMARMLLSEFVHVVSPSRHAPMGGSVLTNQRGLEVADIASAGFDGEREDLFGPLWFAVPKKRVSKMVEIIVLAVIND